MLVTHEKFYARKGWERQYLHSITIEAKLRHFLNSHPLFSFRGDKPKPKQTRLPFSGKFQSTSLKPSKTFKPSTSLNKNILQQQVWIYQPKQSILNMVTNFVAPIALSRRRTQRFYKPIATKLIATDHCGHTWRFFCRSRQCGSQPSSQVPSGDV